jgi:hypothetical protein
VTASIAATLEGLRRAARQPRLALTLWTVNLALAAVAGLTAWLRWRDVLDRAPETDPLRFGLRLGILVDLLEAHRIGIGVLGPLVLALCLVALLVNALTAGGTLEVLLAADSRPFLHQFGRGAGRFFFRFLRAGLLAGLLLGALAGLLVGLVSVVARSVEDSAFEPMPLVLLLVRLAVVLVVVVGVLVALDVARIRLVREDGRRVARALGSALWLVVRHPLAAGGLWLGNALLLALVAAAYIGLCQVVRADAWASIALIAVAQQAVMVCRAGLRVALFGSEIALVGRFWPVVAAPTPAAPAPAEPAPAVPAPAVPAPAVPPAAPTPDEVRELDPEPPSPS